MDRKYLQEVADYNVRIIWARFRKVYPKIPETPPRVEISARLKTTAGLAYCRAKPQYIKLCAELMWEHTEEFIKDIIPHELAHLVDYILHKNAGHGPTWYAVGASLGYKFTRLHNLVNTAWEIRKVDKK